MTAVLESPAQATATSAAGSTAAVPATVPPTEAWALFSSGQAVLMDVRTPEELKFVGHVPGSLNVAWATGTAMTRNPRFARELEGKVGDKHKRVLLLCRSGKRSAAALEVAVKAGFTRISNIVEGFEGELNDAGQRGHADG